MSREDIIKAISENMSIPIEEVEKVIAWSYMQANRAVREGSEVEITGLCKFYMSKSKMRKRIAKLERALDNNPTEKKEKQLKEELEHIKSKLDVETV